MTGASNDFAQQGGEAGEPVLAAPAPPDHNSPNQEVNHG